MKIRPKKLAQGELSNSAALLYEAPANKSVLITVVSLTNNNTTAEEIDLHIVPDGGSATANNKFLAAEELEVGQAWRAWQIEGQILGPGEALYGKSTTANVVAYAISGATVQ